MSFEAFQAGVNRIVSRMQGQKQVPQFRHDNGRHYANFPDGTTIIGNTVSKKVMIRWGSGHCAHASI